MYREKCYARRIGGEKETNKKALTETAREQFRLTTFWSHLVYAKIYFSNSFQWDLRPPSKQIFCIRIIIMNSSCITKFHGNIKLLFTNLLWKFCGAISAPASSNFPLAVFLLQHLRKLSGIGSNISPISIRIYEVHIWSPSITLSAAFSADHDPSHLRNLLGVSSAATAYNDRWFVVGEDSVWMLLQLL